MSMDDEDDQDGSLGIPSDFSQRAMLAEAVNLAHSIDRELRGQVDGMLAEYIRFSQAEAASAAALILTADPRDEIEIFRLQKIAAGYAGVMAWIRGALAEGQSAEMNLNEIDERDQESRDE